MSGLYFVQDENNFINLLLRVGSGSNEKSTGSGGPKINGSGTSSLVKNSLYFISHVRTNMFLATTCLICVRVQAKKKGQDFLDIQ